MPRYPRNTNDLIHTLALAAAYAAVGVLTLSLPETGFALPRMIWLPSGVALGWMMVMGIQLWPGVMLGAALTTALTGGAPLHVVGTGLANAAEIALAVWLLGRWGVRLQLESRRDLLAFVGVLIVTTALSAILSVGSLLLSGGRPSTLDPVGLWFMWWLTHVMGQMVLTPLLLSTPLARESLPRMAPSEALAVSAGLAITLTFTFTPWAPEPLRGAPIAFLSFPFLLWSAYRCGQFGASSASFTAAVFAVGGTLMGSGPFVHGSANMSLFLTLLFVAGVEFSTLFVAGLVYERRQAERAHEELERRLRRSEKLESLGALAGGIAHDFNNLLVAIAGNVDLVLMDTDVDSPHHDPLRESVKASERAAELCRQLLGYAGHGPFEHAMLDLGAIVGDTAELLRVAVPRTALVDFDLDPHPISVRGDPNQLRLVLINVLSNAGDALGRKGGRIAVSTGTTTASDIARGAGVYILDPPSGPCAFLRVTDDGEGIDPHDLERIFEPVFSTRGPGRGIGLASVLGVVRQHEGTIHLESTPGVGSVFTVLLPLADAAVGEPAATPVQPLGRGGTGLIVEADDVVRDAASLLARRLGYETIEAVDVESALELLDQLGGNVAWVLLNMTMTGLDEFEALAKIRGRGWRVPVLLSSDYVREPDEITEEMQPARFLPKPHTIATLRAAIDELLEA